MSWFDRLFRRRRRAACLPLVLNGVRGKSGIEVGGPSPVFRRRKGLLPIYPEVGSLDNCNFASRTVWEGAVQEGETFVFDTRRPPGRQYVAEVSDLSPIPSGKYDFVLSSHVLEHSANSLKALRELLRILRDNGLLVLLLPHREGTFDHRRPVTSLAHLLADEAESKGEDDMTHFEEIMALHDLARDPEAGTLDEFRERSLRNYDNRCFHHHVFDTQLVVSLLDHAGVQLLAVETALPFHIVAVARKLPAGQVPDNRSYLASSALWRPGSVFVSDRMT